MTPFGPLAGLDARASEVPALTPGEVRVAEWTVPFTTDSSVTGRHDRFASTRLFPSKESRGSE